MPCAVCKRQRSTPVFMMPDMRKTKSANHIVVRLRLTFLFIFMGILISAAAGGYLLSDLADNEQNTITYSNASLDYALGLEHHVTNISTAVAKLSLEDTEQGINKLKSFLLNETSVISLYIDTHPVTATIDKDEIDDFQSLLADLENSIELIAPYKVQMAIADATIKNNLDGIAKVRVTYNNLIEPFTHELFLSLDALDLTTENREFEPVRQQIYSQHKLIEITHLMSMLLDNIELLNPKFVQNNKAAVEAQLKSNFNATRQYFPEENSEITPMIDRLRGLTFGSMGLINSIASYRDNQSNFTAAYADTTDIVDKLSSGVHAIADSTKTNVENNSSYFNEILQRINFISLAFAFAVLAIILLVHHFVVERQVNRRIKRLTAAVTDIANGDTDRIVDVSGSDEIGTIAKALEVFKDNAKELHRSNHELEQFAYSASHDLKSPLSAIVYLAQWTLEDAEDELSEDSKDNLKLLVSRAERLSQLQTDLLEYSKAGKADSSIDKLDSDLMVTELAEILDPEQRFSISVSHPSEELLVKITPFRQVLLNLINNAVKHHDKPTGEIHIKMHVEYDRLVVSVTDDGPGIAVEFHDQIFELFEKLVSQDSVEGSGLGLSLVRKIVQTNGGSISVESNPDIKRGTTFTFDWPLVCAMPDQKIAVGY